MEITFTTAWYDLGAKFGKNQYYEWATNLLKNVRLFNLIVYVEDEENARIVRRLSHNNPRVYPVIFPFNDLPLYGECAAAFEENHRRNVELNGRVSWKLVLLWCSKQYLVEKTELEIAKGGVGVDVRVGVDVDVGVGDTGTSRGFAAWESEYPSIATPYYGWMDIGYFRSRPDKLGELTGEQIHDFPNPAKIRNLRKDRIHYALVNPPMMEILRPLANIRNTATGLPRVPLPANQISIAGGFFVLAAGGASSIWREQFETHLLKYLKGGYVVKDDQYVIVDLMLLNPMAFQLWVEPPRPNVDSWFLFQRFFA